MQNAYYHQYVDSYGHPDAKISHDHHHHHHHQQQQHQQQQQQQQQEQQKQQQEQQQDQGFWCGSSRISYKYASHYTLSGKGLTRKPLNVNRFQQWLTKEVTNDGCSVHDERGGEGAGIERGGGGGGGGGRGWKRFFVLLLVLVLVVFGWRVFRSGVRVYTMELWKTCVQIVEDYANTFVLPMVLKMKMFCSNIVQNTATWVGVK